jgi:hypothetical protein
VFNHRLADTFGPLQAETDIKVGRAAFIGIAINADN